MVKRFLIALFFSVSISSTQLHGFTNINGILFDGNTITSALGASVNLNHLAALPGQIKTLQRMYFLTTVVTAVALGVLAYDKVQAYLNKQKEVKDQEEESAS